MRIGPYPLAEPVVLAPMAGVADAPFRRICREYGAALAVCEMTSANPALRGSRKSMQRRPHAEEPAPRSVQILGNDLRQMADAARYNVDLGAQIIDINMGCPAKKVCRSDAGSALLRDEALVANILDAVVKAVDVPVTLKMRTGWSAESRNGVAIAKIAESAGIQALAVHGRTRACGFVGEVEYDTVAAIKAAVRIPVLVNGDITGPQEAKTVLERTGADGVMIGRAALGNPWIFRDIVYYLRTGEQLPSPSLQEIADVLAHHLHGLHAHYGEELGVRVARKHVSWYSDKFTVGSDLRRAFNQVSTPAHQIEMIQRFFHALDEEKVELAA